MKEGDMAHTPGLLAVTHWVLRLASALSAAAAALLGLALCAVPLIASNLDPNHFGAPATIEGVARGQVLAVAAFYLASGLICLLLILFALRVCDHVVRVAMAGDPFVTENADRLARVGWLLLAMEMLGLLTDLVTGLFVPRQLHGHFSSGIGVSPVGLLAVLLVFALAHIFRHGSAMRAELEGTI